MFGDEEVGADHAGQFRLEGVRALEFEDMCGLALVQPTGDPFRLLTFEALAVKEVYGTIELEKDAAKRIDFLCNCCVQSEWGRGYAPFMTGEKALSRQGISNGLRC